MSEPTKQQTHTMTTECPNCDGDGGHIDDDNPNGWQVCSYCDGKAIVSYREAEEWHDWEDEGGANLM